MQFCKVSGCFILGCTLFISACDQAPVKTESILFRERADKASQPFVKKAARLFTAQVSQDPMDHLDTLIIVKHALRDARNVYQKKNISNWQNAELVTLQQQLEASYAEIAQQSIPLLNLAVDRTVQLRNKVEAIRSQPKAMSNSGIGAQLDSIVREYGDDVDTCCLLSLAQIDELLLGNAGTYRDLNRLLRRLDDKLQSIMDDKHNAAKLREEIEVVGSALNH